MSTKQRAKHLPLLLQGACDCLRLRLELDDLKPKTLRRLKNKLWIRITKNIATDDEHDLFERIDAELSRYSFTSDAS